MNVAGVFCVLTGTDGGGVLYSYLAWMEVGWSEWCSCLDGAGVVCVLTCQGWRWGGLSTDLAWMELQWSEFCPCIDGGGVVCELS